MVDLGNFFAYILNKKAFDTEYVGQYKTKKAYSYFISGFVHEIFSFNFGADKIVLKAKVTPSQKVREDPRETWVLCTKRGDVLVAHCTCTAGFGECCNHIVAVLYKVEFANTNMLIDPACTSEACVLNKTTRRDVEASRIRDFVIRTLSRLRDLSRPERFLDNPASKIILSYSSFCGLASSFLDALKQFCRF